MLGLNTTWSSAQTRTWTDSDGDSDDGPVTVSCAPATATLTLSNGSSTTDALSGKTCSVTRNGATTFGFAGTTTDGVKAFVKENGTAVTGVVFSGFDTRAGLFFGFRHHDH